MPLTWEYERVAGQGEVWIGYTARHPPHFSGTTFATITSRRSSPYFDRPVFHVELRPRKRLLTSRLSRMFANLEPAKRWADTCWAAYQAAEVEEALLNDRDQPTILVLPTLVGTKKAP